MTQVLLMHVGREAEALDALRAYQSAVAAQLTSPAMTLQLLDGVRIATPYEMELTDKVGEKEERDPSPPRNGDRGQPCSSLAESPQPGCGPRAPLCGSWS